MDRKHLQAGTQLVLAEVNQQQIDKLWKNKRNNPNKLKELFLPTTLS